MKTYDVAIIIPTLNEERFIEACLLSVIRQTYPFEKMDVMVVDGGSRDRTRNIVKSFVEKYPNVRLILNPGKIQSIAFNIGVKHSIAPYIIRLDAHAVYDRSYIEKCLEVFSADAELLGGIPELVGNVGGRWTILPQHSGLVAEAAAILNQSKFGIGGAAFRVGGKAGYVDSVPFGCFPRSVIDKIGGMREDFARGEDNEYNYRIRKYGYKIWFDPEIVATYYARDTIKSNVKQMYANGYSIGKLLLLDFHIICVRHLVPMIFVCAIILLLIGGIFLPSLHWLLCLMLILYFLLAIIASIKAGYKYGTRFIAILPIMFFCVHISYGYGTLISLVSPIRSVISVKS